MRIVGRTFQYKGTSDSKKREKLCFEKTHHQNQAQIKKRQHDGKAERGSPAAVKCNQDS